MQKFKFRIKPEKHLFYCFKTGTSK